MRGKKWSIDEERQLRQLVSEGMGIEKISQAMRKTRVSIRSKMYHLGLVLVDATDASDAIDATGGGATIVASTKTKPKWYILDLIETRVFFMACDIFSMPMPSLTSWRSCLSSSIDHRALGRRDLSIFS